MALCANCGAKVPDDAAHCVQCGSSMTAAQPTGPSKKTMTGLSGVDQKELQRAIEAARAATASGEAPKKSARRTMMGVAAISVQQIEKAAASKKDEALDEDWGAPAGPGKAAAADDLDGGWGEPEASPPRASAPLPLVAAPPTRPATPLAKATVALSSMPAPTAAPPAPRPAAAPAPTRPVTSPRTTMAFEAAPSAAEPRGPATIAPAAGPVAPPRPTTGPKATVAFSAMAAPPTSPATQSTPPTAPPRPTTGSRGLGEAAAPPRPSTGSRAAVEAPAATTTASRTVAFGAMAVPPTAASTQPPARPTTGSRAAAAAPPAAPDAFESAPTPLPPDVEFADTISSGRELASSLATLRSETAAAAQEPIAPSSPDPLADTISPGSMRIDSLLREVQASAEASEPAASVARQASSATAPTPIPAQTPMPSIPAASAAAISSTGLKKSGTTTKPPFLASKALAEDIHPTEPGRAEMRLAAILGGIVLTALWAVPVTFAPLAFAWQSAAPLTGAPRVFAFYAPVAGLLLVGLGAAPVPYRVRALGALVLGMVPIIGAVGGLGPLEATRGWPGALLSVGFILLPGALVHRANYRASVLARMLVALGLVLVLAWMFVPGGSGFLPAMIRGFSSTRGIVQSVVMIGALLLVVASLLAFMPSATTGGAGKTGRLLLLARPALAAASAVAAGTERTAPIALAVSLVMLFVCGTLASLGTAQTLASIERPAS